MSERPVGGIVSPPFAVAYSTIAAARTTYEDVCSQCHELADVDAAPPMSADESSELIRRMITENDAELTKEQIEACHAYMVAHFVDKKI